MCRFLLFLPHADEQLAEKRPPIKGLTAPSKNGLNRRSPECYRPGMKLVLGHYSPEMNPSRPRK